MVIFILQLSKSKVFTDKKHQVFVFETEDQAESFYGLAKEHHDTLYFPDLGQNIFSGVYSNERNLNDRLLVLNQLHASEKSFHIVTSYQALFLKNPPKSFFQTNGLDIRISDIVSPSDLALKLTEMGYTHSPTVEEPGSFTQKGEIFDIYPLAGRPVRLHYFDDMIEEIFPIHKENLRTDRSSPLDRVSVYPMSGSALTSEGVTNFRENLPRPPLNHRAQNILREDYLKKLDGQTFFPNYPLYFSLFFSEWTTLAQALEGSSAFHFFNRDDAQKALELSFEELVASITQIKKTLRPTRYFQVPTFYMILTKVQYGPHQ